MAINDKLKKLGISRSTNKFVGKSLMEKVIDEGAKPKPEKISDVSQYKKELKNIAAKAKFLRDTELELERIEEEILHKIRVELINKTISSPFTQGKEVDFESVKQKAVEEYLPKAFIPEQIEYPEPFELEPALNRELAEFKRKINQHLAKMGFAGSGGGGSERIADMQDVDGSAQVNGRFLKYEESSSKWIGDAGPKPDIMLLEDGSSDSLVLDTAEDAGDNLLYEEATGDFLLVLASHGMEISGTGWGSLTFGGT